MKKQNILISLLSIACLVGCGGQPASKSNGGGDGSSEEQGPKADLVITDFGTVRIEAEDFNLDYWESDESYEGQTYVCPVCGTINPQDIAACTHCGRNKARSIILLNKGKISQAKAVKRKIDIIKAPQADVSPDPNPTFAEFAQGKFEPVDMDTDVPTPSAQMPQTNMPYGAPGMQNGGQNIGFNNYPQGNPYMYYGRDPYQMPPILQPVAFVPYVTQEQPLMQYTPADSYNKQKVTVKPLEQNGQNIQSNGAKEVKPDDSEI